MPTLEQLAQSGRTERTTTSVAGKGQRINAAQPSKAERLAGDLLNIGSNVSKTVQARNTASVTLANRTATQNITAMSNDITALNAEVTDTTDPLEVSKANTAIYHNYSKE